MFGFIPPPAPALDMRRLKQMEQLQLEGRHQQLIPLYEELLGIQPGLGLAWHGRGMSLLELGFPEEAAASFQQARQCGGPGTEAAALMEATCLRQLVKPDLAVQLLEEARRQPGVGPDMLRQLEFAQVQAHLQAAQPAQALNTLDHYLAQGGPDTDIVRHFRVEALARSGQHPEARRCLAQMPHSDLGRAMQEILKEKLIWGHPGLVDLASKRAHGVDPQQLAWLNDPIAVHVQRHLGPLQEIVAQPPCSVLVIRPGRRGAPARLVSHGISEQEQPGPRRCEMMIAVPPECRAWVPLLGQLAAYPRDHQIYLERGAMVPFQGGPQHGYAGFLVFPSISVAGSFYVLQTPTQRIEFLSVYPLYPEELAWAQSAGLEALLAALEQHQIGDFTPLQRPHCLPG